SRNTLAVVLRASGRREEAMQELHSAQELFAQLAVEPGWHEYKSLAALPLHNLGRIAYRGKDHPLALLPLPFLYQPHNLAFSAYREVELARADDDLKQAIALQREALAKDPNNPAYAKYLASHYELHASILLDRKRHPEAAKEAEKMREVLPGDGNNLWESA